MNLSGQITITTAGTAVQGPNIDGGNFWIKALPGNTGIIYVGNVDGDVSSSNGFPLSAGEVIYCNISGLDALWFDASISGEKVAWFKAE